MSGAAVDLLYQAISTRAVPLSLRKDLTIAQHVYRSEPFWVIKDPLGLKYHRLNEQEYTLLTWVDGKTSLKALCDRFNDKFSPDRVTVRDIQTFIGDMHKKVLLISPSRDQGRHLLDMAVEQKRKELKQKITNIMCLRWRGVDPERFLDFMAPVGTRLFSTPCVVASLLFTLSSLVLLSMNWETFAEESPSVQEFFKSIFQKSNWLAMAGVIGVTKVLHELGHAFCFKRFGGECHEIGVMLLFGTPTLYCNTSDSWLLPSKWHRAAIGMAGMYVESFIFAVAAYGWWWSASGEMFHYVCLNLMVVCSLSALLLNGNPLLKYDGYFVLADLIEIPNLQQRSGEALQKIFTSRCLGLHDDHDLLTPARIKRILVAYAIAAFIYRIFLTIAIAFIIAQLLRPVGLEQVGIVSAALILIFFVTKPFHSLYKRLKKPGALAMVKPRRAAATAAVFLLLVSLLLVPLPKYILCDFSFEATQATEVRVDQGGSIVEVRVRPGESVQQGDLIMRLENQEMRKEQLDLIQAIKKMEARRRNVLVDSNSSKRSQLGEIDAGLQKHRQQLEVLDRRIEHLSIRAPQSGVVCSVSDRSAQSRQEGQSMPTWSGDPLHPDNAHAWLRSQDSVCIIADSTQMTPILVVPQKEAELIQAGMPVTMMLDSYVSTRLHGKIESVSVAVNEIAELTETLATRSQAQIAQLQASQSPDAKQADRDDPTSKMQAPLLQAKVTLQTQSALQVGIGSGGKAKIYIGKRSAWWRVRRWLLEMFRLKF